MSDSSLLPSESQFVKLPLATARQWYELGLIKATAYLLIILDLRKAPEWNWAIGNVRDFCATFGIKRSAFYRAMASLEEMGFIDEATSPQAYTVGAHRLYLSHLRDSVAEVGQCRRSGTQIPQVGRKSQKWDANPTSGKMDR